MVAVVSLLLHLVSDKYLSRHLCPYVIGVVPILTIKKK
jgi:hypothetical protein